jgi:hypothetical protein
MRVRPLCHLNGACLFYFSFFFLFSLISCLPFQNFKATLQFVISSDLASIIFITICFIWKIYKIEFLFQFHPPLIFFIFQI